MRPGVPRPDTPRPDACAPRFRCAPMPRREGSAPAFPPAASQRHTIPSLSLSSREGYDRVPVRFPHGSPGRSARSLHPSVAGTSAAEGARGLPPARLALCKNADGNTRDKDVYSISQKHGDFQMIYQKCRGTLRKRVSSFRVEALLATGRVPRSPPLAHVLPRRNPRQDVTPSGLAGLGAGKFRGKRAKRPRMPPSGFDRVWKSCYN